MDCERYRRRQQEPRWLTAFQIRWECPPDMEGPADRRGKPPKIPPPPQPTAEERALQQEQVQLLQFQRAALERQQQQQELLQPFFFEAAGLEPTFFQPDEALISQLQSRRQELTAQLANTPETMAGEGRGAGLRRVGRGGIGMAITRAIPNPAFNELQQQIAEIDRQLQGATGREGEITGFTRRPDPFREQQERILGLQLGRSEAALRGELPVDPALIRALDGEEEDLRNFLRQRFGPDFETASPAIEALAEQRKRKNETLDAARRGDLTLAEGLSMAREGGLQRQTDLFLSRGAGTAGLAGATAPGFGSAAAGFGEPISFLRNQRLLEYDVVVRNLLARKQFQNQLIATGVGVGLGAVGGAALGPAVGLSAGSGALVGATGNIGTLPFLSMQRGEEDLRFPRRA